MKTYKFLSLRARDCSRACGNLTILTLILVVASVVPVFASAATSAGVTPGSFWYFFDTASEKIGLFFTFNPEAKAKKALEYADERLAEIEAIAEEKNPEAVKAAIADYEGNVALATEKSKEVKDDEQAESLFASIESSASKNQEVLSAVLIKVPEEAKAAITQAIEASKKGQEEAARQIVELKGEVEKLKQEVAELKAKDEEKQRSIEELNEKKVESPTMPARSFNSQIPEVAPTIRPVTPSVQSSTKTINIVTFPSGAVVELGADGNVMRTIKEAPQPTYVDVCENIEGAQTVVSSGMQWDNNQKCIPLQQNTQPAPVVDLCNNIEGAQSYIPSGMTGDGSGNCTVYSAPTPIPTPTSPAVLPPQTPTPTSATPTPTSAQAPTPTLTQPTAPNITVSVSSDTPNGGDITKGTKNVGLLKLNFENTGDLNAGINGLKLKLVGGSKNNFGKFRIGDRSYTPVFTDEFIELRPDYFPIDGKSNQQLFIQADIPLTATTNDVFRLELVSASGIDPAGRSYQVSGTAIGKTFTISQPPITSNSPTVSLAPNTVFGLTDNQCTSGCSYIGTILRFDAKNNPLSILKLALTFDGVNEADIKNVKLLWGGNIYYKLYPVTTYSANDQKVAYIEGNKVIFQNFSPYELTHVNPNEIMDLTIKFESNPTGIGKTIRIDLVNPLIDIVASNYETGLVLSVDGSAIGNAIFINKQ